MMSESHVEGASFVKISFDGTSNKIYGMKKTNKVKLKRWASSYVLLLHIAIDSCMVRSEYGFVPCHPKRRPFCFHTHVPLNHFPDLSQAVI
jgi:hypothetical protein